MPSERVLSGPSARQDSFTLPGPILGGQVTADVITTGDVDPVNRGAADPWAAGDKLYVGRSGPATLTVQAGGVVTNARGYLGYESESSGIVTVTGAGSLGTAPKDCIWSGYGSLDVEAGGLVTTMHGYLGYDSGATGEATVTGTGSQWDTSGRLRVGVSGSGTLDVEAGGLVTVLGTTKLWSTATLNRYGGSLTTGSFDNSELGTLNFHDGTLTVNGVGGWQI